MLYREINEGATLVHEIDREARRALETSLHSYMDTLWRPFNPNGYNEEDPDEHHRDYQKFYDHYQIESKRKALLTQICMVSGGALTKVIQNDLQKRFGSYIMFDKAKISTVTMSVEVTVRPTEGDDAHKGGYFSPGLSWSYIKVHVNAEDIFTAAMAAVQLLAFGESFDEDALVNSIAPTFAHEYSHLLQYLGAKSYSAFTRGVTTVKGKDGRRSKGGVRQGDRSRSGWWRYVGSTAEIDSFASSVASEMIAAKESRRWSNGDLDNTEIDYSLRDISDGYASNKWYEMYLKQYQAALADEYQDIGLSKKEASLVWKRFLKTLYAKINAYKRAAHGKDKTGFYTGKADAQWVAWAKLGLSKCAARIADQLAFECADQSYQNYEGEWRIEPNEPFQKATQFLEAYFYDDANYDFKRSMKIDSVLKALIIRRIPHYRQREAA